MKFSEMARPAVLQDAVDLGLEIARDISPEAVFQYEKMMLQNNARIIREIQSQERHLRIEAMRQNVEMDDSDETTLGFSQFEPFHFQRNAAFLEMLQLTAKNGLDPLTPEIFNKCFEVSAE